ncbi:MAG: hypothetical protein PHS49_05935 [Candidatus Gracilibacteria bacterium]|nr:hypothetical protein [Candidatus Gracilibacteria bacterium]
MDKKNSTETDKSKKVVVRKVKKYNSYETAINILGNRYKNDAKAGKVKIGVIGGKEIDLKKKTIIGVKGPLELTAEEQTNLWLVDLFSRIKDERKQHLANMLIGSQWDAKQFYNKVQHTAPKADTADVVNSFMVHAGKMEIIV